MDAATKDRLVQLHVGYDEKLERALIPDTTDCHRYCDKVQAIRAAVSKLAIQHLVTPRQTLTGCDLIVSKGYSVDDVLRDLVQRNLDSAQWSKITTEARL